MKWTIGRKLACGFGAVLLLWVVTNGILLLQIQRIGGNLSERISRSGPMVQAAYEMEIHMIETGFAVEQYLHNQNPDNLNTIKDVQQAFQTAQQLFLNLADTPLKTALAQEAGSTYHRFSEQGDALISIADQTHRKTDRIHTLLKQTDTTFDDWIEANIDTEAAGGEGKSRQAMEMEINVNGVAKLTALFTEDPSAENEMLIQDDIEDFYRAFELYMDLPLSEKETRTAGMLRVQFDEIATQTTDFIRLEKDRGLAHAMFTKSWKEIDDLLDEEVQILAKNAMQKSNAATARSVSETPVPILLFIGIGLLTATAAAIAITRSVTHPVSALQIAAQQVQEGNLPVEATITSGGEIGELAKTFNEMIGSLKTAREDRTQQEWVNSGLKKLDDVLRAAPDLLTLSRQVITQLTTHLQAPTGAFYILENDALTLTGSYAYNQRKNLSSHFKPGEGLAGQALLEKQRIIVSNVPHDYMTICTSTLEASPRFICTTPLVLNNRALGVFEIGSLHEWNPASLQFLDQATERIATAVLTVQSRDKTEELLKESQALSEKLQTQQEELRTTNEELEEHTQALRTSEEQLRNQQEELQVTNEELEEKTESLEGQKRELTKSARQLNEKAEELTLASRYKSEFLANMSHELRTPLNSLLILSGSLVENEEGNLSEDQVESLQVIQSSGKDLLLLINEILDLSKIEAGQMDLHLKTIPVEKLQNTIRSNFQHVFEHKGLKLEIAIEPSAPTELISDEKRIGQILKNLISNAVKFTSEGGVTVTFSGSDLLKTPGLCIAVTDTGIGIPKEKQAQIFEAFQQADGSTVRKYGGTGLGLSISRELTHLLGGELSVESEEGKGSEFRIVLPTQHATEDQSTDRPAKQTAKAVPPRAASVPEFGTLPDDRNALDKDHSAILVIEDDPQFAKVLLKECREKGFQCLAAISGEEGLYLAEKHTLAAIILDLKLPGIDGWSTLDRLKNNVRTRHIPVHIMSAADPTQQALNNGAIGFLQKPASRDDLHEAFARIGDLIDRDMKELLVIEDDENLREAILKLIGNGDVHGTGTGQGEAALDMMRSQKYDCIILDLNLTDMTGFKLLETADQDDQITLPPVIVYTGRELTREEEELLINYSESIIVKGVRSRERLFDEASLFLHRVVEKMPEKKKQMITNLHNSDQMFAGKKVLVVDDDMRNLFALSSALSAKGMIPIKAQDGQKALQQLHTESEISLILMDIMMPVMDGYETIKQIRSQSRFQNLAIIALTAKAMKDDRAKCIEAGANDYLPKPIDIDRLFSMMRVWMYR